MENKIRKVAPEILIEHLLELMNEAEAVPLLISGNSMVPFMVDGRDTVFLSKVRRKLKKGDMILYSRHSGIYVLHRICKVTIDEGMPVYSLVGDAQTIIENGIREDQILAVVTAVERKGKLLQNKNFLWFFFEKVWLRIIPIRPILLKMYTFIKGGRKEINQ